MKSTFFSLYLLASTHLCSADITLDQYLDSQGFKFPTDVRNFSSPPSDAQKRQFNRQLRTHPEIRMIVQVGLGTGHVAENFFQNCPSIEQYVCFDLRQHPYTRPVADYLKEKYPSRFVFIEGNSLQRVPKFTKHYPNLKFDLIYIDGNHAYEYFMKEIRNMQTLAYPGTFLWVDDMQHPEVEQAIDACEELGIIEIQRVFESEGPSGKKSWVEARYR